MKYLFIGLDPGATGAMAAVDEDGELVEYERFPTLMDGKKKVMDTLGVVKWLADREVSGELRVTIEKVHAMPGNGATSMFSFGRSLGLLEGVVVAGGLSRQYATPQAWQKVMLAGKLRGKGQTKHSAVKTAMELWPQLYNTLRIKANWGIADAALIAEFGRRQWEGAK